ncbi:MAG: hypothetical protein KDM63_22150, partial [Verrucomicrobiae bacterium]|nr:hypothetical protein [Verrucomicrobiae bacterium]
AITITEWDIEDYSDRAIELAREIIQGDTTEFDRQVRAFFESELQSKDAPLPPLEWGDRPWHTWEAKPEEQTGENKRMESNG